MYYLYLLMNRYTVCDRLVCVCVKLHVCVSVFECMCVLECVNHCHVDQNHDIKCFLFPKSRLYQPVSNLFSMIAKHSILLCYMRSGPRVHWIDMHQNKYRFVYIYINLNRKYWNFEYGA